MEAGCQKLLLEEAVNAAERFATAVGLDELSLDANAGALEAQIMQGELEEAANQVGGWGGGGRGTGRGGRPWGRSTACVGGPS